jgi:hypothetical protein
VFENTIAPTTVNGVVRTSDGILTITNGKVTLGYPAGWKK